MKRKYSQLALLAMIVSTINFIALIITILIIIKR